MRQEGLEPGPRRGEGTWDAFVRRHAQSLWACDFFTKKVWTRTGLVDVFMLFFLHVGSRRVFLAGMSARPDAAWVGQQARTAVLRHVFDRFHFVEKPPEGTEYSDISGSSISTSCGSFAVIPLLTSSPNFVQLRLDFGLENFNQLTVRIHQ